MLVVRNIIIYLKRQHNIYWQTFMDSLLAWSSLSLHLLFSYTPTICINSSELLDYIGKRNHFVQGKGIHETRELELN
jgi:hypothetical protein